MQHWRKDLTTDDTSYMSVYDWQSQFHWDLPGVYWQKRITQVLVEGIRLWILNRQYRYWQWRKICDWNTTRSESRKGTLSHLRWTFNRKSLGLLKTICYKVVTKYFIQNRIEESCHILIYFHFFQNKQKYGMIPWSNSAKNIWVRLSW